MEISEMLETIDIVDFISQFVELEEKNGEYWGLSPFKEENTPSFSVRRETGRFYCFSSGIGGNAITFLKFYYDISAHEAVEKLKQIMGITDGKAEPKRKMTATLMCKKYAKPKNQKKTSAAVILPDDYMERYEKREDKLKIWLDEGISKESLERFDVCYDSFSDRLVYPIRNVDGKIVNVGGRALDPMWKEKGQRKYCYFHSWGTLDTIYGLAENLKYILEKKEIILFEGCKSVLIADTWGIKNAGAILTSHLNPNQMKILARLGCRVVFALDKDVRIREDHNINKLKKYVNVEYLWDKADLLSDKDAPVDKGFETFKELYDSRLILR